MVEIVENGIKILIAPTRAYLSASQDAKLRAILSFEVV